MTAPRLHIFRISPAQAFDDQAVALLKQLTPLSANISISSAEEAWKLAEFVDLVDAGYGKKNLTYSAARMALTRFVRASWKQRDTAGLLGRSAILSQLLEDQLDQQARAFDAEFGGIVLAA